jgi:hypothetical protein
LLFLLVNYAGSTKAVSLYGHESSFRRVVDWKERFNIPSLFAWLNNNDGFWVLVPRLGKTSSAPHAAGSRKYLLIL